MASLGSLSFPPVAEQHRSPAASSQSSLLHLSPSIASRASVRVSSPPPRRSLSACCSFNGSSPCLLPFALLGNSVKPNLCISAAKNPEPLKIVISGAPASGKGTQCEFIKNKYGLAHIAAGDLLRAEVAAGTENGKLAKEYMEKGMLVPEEIVVVMVKERLLKSDALENGWILDGYPRSLSQAKALEDVGIRPDLFILLVVDEDTLVERVLGRRLDPVTGKIYHLKYSPPENDEIAARLVQRFDDTEEKVKLRLKTHHENVEAVLSLYEDITVKVHGNVSKQDVFAEIDRQLISFLEKKYNRDSASMAAGMAT